ncbi:MAG: hypothetical protein KBT31_06615 [Firmicutes bacterium]|nr:hypothetical protein [Candidatus Colimorpha enterica]
MKTKYPILLVHGAGVRDFLFFRSFGKIDRILRIQNYTVYKSGIDGFGTIENNAAQLKEEIENILKKEGAEKVNIIAHSKGGLDSKYMIDSLGMADRVASLTTLATPHRGSPIASFILKAPKWILKIYAFFIDLAFRTAGDEAPDCFTVCEQLKRIDSAPPEKTFFSDRVYCQSFSSAVRKGEKGNDFVMSIPLMFSRLIEKDAVTDGLVPKDSAIFGEYRGEIGGSVSHTEIIDFMVADSKKDKIYSFWSALCEELVNMGF